MNTLLATGHLPLLLLVVGLFFPRLTLFFAWFFSAYPHNPLSDLVNFVLWIFFPRFLIAYYIYVDIGTSNLWFWAYVVTGVLGFFGESGAVHRRVRRTRRVTRDGETVTTVEEEEL
jgi:hypothetical protein